MNWSKIKTIFIILLVAANLIIFFLFNFQKENDLEVNESELEQIFSDKMLEKGIDVKNLEPITAREVKVLFVLSEDIDLLNERTAYTKLGFNTYNADQENGYLYSYDNLGNLNIDIFEVPVVPEELITKELAIESSKKYLPDFQDGVTSYKFSSCYANFEGDYDVHYEQLYKGIPVPDGYIRIRMRGDIPLNLNQKRVYISEKENKVQSIVPYSHALYMLYSGIKNEDLPIVFDEVSIVHQLKSDDQENGLISGETFPYYRFVSKENGVYLIKALSDFER